jgi:hypothetical protein
MALSDLAVAPQRRTSEHVAIGADKTIREIIVAGTRKLGQRQLMARLQLVF